MRDLGLRQLVPTFWPSWLTGRPEAPSLFVPGNDPPTHQLSWSPKIPIALQPQAAFRKYLPQCRSLLEVKELVYRLEINLHNDPTLSSEILQHFLELKGGFGEARNSMLDRSVNARGSQCLSILLQWFRVKPRSKSHRDHLYEYVRNSLSLGLYSPTEIQLLLDHLPNIKVCRNGIDMRLLDTAGAQSWFWMIARKLEGCPVLSLKDLSQPQLQQLLDLNRQSPFAPCAIDTFRAVERFVLDQRQLKVAEACRLTSLLISAERDQELDAEDLRKVVDLFSSLRSDLTAEAILRLTQQFMSQRERSVDQLGVLDKWIEILSKIPSVSRSSIIKQQVWMNLSFEGDDYNTPASKDASQDPQSGHGARREVAMRLWTLTQLANGFLNILGCTDGQHVTNILARIFRETLRPHQDFLTEFALSLQPLPLSSSSTVLQNVARTPAAGLNSRDTPKQYENALSTLSSRPLDLFRENEIYQTAKFNMRQTLMNMAQQTSSNPYSFLQTAHELIMRDPDSVKMIIRILKCNTAMKLALAHACRTPMQAQWMQPASSSDHDCLIAPDTALRTLNALACSFAISPALTPRDSFRKVYWVYQYLYRYADGSAIGPQITTALWHAGVTRFGPTGTSPEKVRWILRVVREVEGNQAADDLLFQGRKYVEG